MVPAILEIRRVQWQNGILYILFSITDTETVPGFDRSPVSYLCIASYKTAEIVVIIFQKYLFVFNGIVIHFTVFANSKPNI